MNAVALFHALLLAFLVSACNGVQESKVGDDVSGISTTTSLAITPTFHTMYVNESFQFLATGGTEPYSFSVVLGGGTISSSGLYTAPATKGNVTVRLTDSAGTTKDALIIVDVQLVLLPATAKLSVNRTLQFSTTGGTLPYTYSVTSGTSTIDSAGVLTAAASPETVVVRVVDANGYSDDATIDVGNGPILNKTVWSMPVGTSYQFSVTSGTAPFTWSVVSGGGSISAAGLYTAPATNGTATVRVTDSLGYYHEAVITYFKKHIVSAGTHHTCITNATTNATRCYGARGSGMTGEGNAFIGEDYDGSKVRPVLMPAALTAEPLLFAKTFYAGCALYTDSLLRCWGYSGYGENGNNTTTTGLAAGDSELIQPVPADPSNPFIDVARGGDANHFMCGILQNGDVKCWGYNGYGQLGQGNTLNYGQNWGALSVYSMSPVPLGQAATRVSTGNHHTCAILADGNVKCWGRNLVGELGLGHTNPIGDAAGEVAAAATHNFAQDVLDLALGLSYTCVITRADAVMPLKTYGDVYCWGENNAGNLGVGNTTVWGDTGGELATNATRVDLGTGMYATKIDAGYGHTCALLINGKVKCWGWNGYGNLGLEHTNTIGDGGGEMGDNLPFVFLGTGRTAVDIAVGGHQACAELDNGEVKCWGSNEYSMLGGTRKNNKGDQVNEMGDNLLPIALGSSVTAIHSMEVLYTASCFLVTDNGAKTIKCLGRDDNGSQGNENGLNGDHVHEMGLNTPPVNYGTSKTIASMSANHALNCVLFTDGTAKCHGYNNNPYNILGTNNASGVNEVGAGVYDMGTALPYVISGGGATITAFATAAGNPWHYCAIFDSANLKCWGYNGTGQLGQDNTTVASHIPSISAINLGSAPTSVSIGENHTCASLANGTVKCWGYNGYGQLGKGNTTDLGDTAGEMAALTAIDLGAGFSAVSVCAQTHTSCALSAAGNVKCWGMNSTGEAGQAHINHIGDGGGEMGASLPNVNIGTGRTATKLVCGNNHACVLTDDNKVKCWGYNGYGQLGRGDTINIYGASMGDNLVPVDFGTDRFAIEIYAAGFHNCALLDNNTVKCWGANHEAQLANGTTARAGDNLGEMGNALQAIQIE